MALELHHILPRVGPRSQHRHHQDLQQQQGELAANMRGSKSQPAKSGAPSRAAYLIDDAAVRVERESVLHEMAARPPRRLRRCLPSGSEHAVDDSDGVGAREPNDSDRRGAATEGGDDGRDGPGSAAPASAAVVMARLVRQGRRRGRALVAGEDECVGACSKCSGTAWVQKAATEEAGRRRPPPWEEEGEEASGGAGHRIGMSSKRVAASLPPARGSARPC